MVKKYVFTGLLMIAIQARAQDELGLPELVTVTDMGLKGPVMSVEQSMYDMIPRQGELKPPGHPLAYTDTLRILKEEVSCFFDEEARLQREVMGVVDERKDRITSFTTTRYYYYSDGLSAIVHEKDEQLSDSIFVDRSRNGRIRNMYIYDKKGKRTGRLQFTYDRAGRLITIRKKDENNALLRMERLSYNKDGRLAERIIYGADIQRLAGKEYAVEELDSGKVQHNCFLKNEQDAPRGMIAYVTDAQNRKIEYTVADSNRRVTEYRIIAYTNVGNISEETVFADRKLHFTYSYVYDEKGNWIEQKVYHNGVPAATITRHIFYYSTAR